MEARAQQRNKRIARAILVKSCTRYPENAGGARNDPHEIKAVKPVVDTLDAIQEKYKMPLRVESYAWFNGRVFTLYYHLCAF